ncbi:MAG: TIM barrel protein [Candidatus Woesearchaeota archaeon]
MKRYTKLHIGTAGIPLSTPKGGKTPDGVKRVAELGLNAMEMEFVHSVNVSEEQAPNVKKIADDNGIAMTCHGQYYINLSSLEEEKIDASVNRVLHAARRAHLCGAQSVTFHAGFYQKRSPEEVYPIIKEQMKKITGVLEDEGNPIFVCPETTGKETQFGTLKEVIKLSQELPQVLPCIDFSHIHARSNGKWNSTEEFRQIFEELEKGCGKDALHQMHCHISGIAYGEKGEKHHLILEESDMKYKELMGMFKEFNAKGVVICESPNIEEDALLLKKVYEGK